MAQPDAALSKRGADTRSRLIDAARAVFEEQGLVDARVAHIAKQAGVSYGVFYHYFDSKEEAFREVALGVVEALGAGMEILADRTSKASPHERLAAAIRVHFTAYQQAAQIIGVIDRESRHDPDLHAFWTTLLSKRHQEVVANIQFLQRHGLADPELDADIAASALGAMMWRFAQQWLVDGVPACDFETGVEQVTRIYENALQLKQKPPAPR